MAFEEVEGRGDFPPTLTLEEGETLTGILIASHRVTADGKYGKRETTVYYLRPETEVVIDGEKAESVALWGSVDLDGKLGQLPVPSRVRITYNGKEDLDGGRQMKVYAVARDADWNEDDIPF